MHKKTSVKHIDLTNFDFFHLKVFIYARFYGTIITIRTMISKLCVSAQGERILCHRLYWQVWTDGEKNMSKYDKMLELNKRKSEEKVERAVLTIRTMVLEREKVSVPALMQKTGLSRGFFYKNPIVRGEIDAAMEQQAGMVDPRRNIISQAMEAEMNLLRQQLQKLKSENENLIKENQKLKKALSKKELNLIKQI